MKWHAEIVEGFQGAPEANDLSCAKLAAVLTRLSGEGWTVAHVLVNGVNRWTVIAWR